MRSHVRIIVCFICFSAFTSTIASAQSKPFIPLEFEYPASQLAVPKTYVYRNIATGTLRYKDLALEKKGTDVVVHWKEYDESPIKDSCTEINDKGLDHYMILNDRAIKAVVTEDSIYADGSRLGEKVQTLYFNLNETISLFSTNHSVFLKDTTITWQEKSVPCLVIQSFYRQKLTNSLVPDKPKEINGTLYFYFGKDVGLLMYRSEVENEKATWQLAEIKDLKN